MTAEVEVGAVLSRGKLYTSPVVHLIDTDALRLPDTQEGREPSLCQIKPVWPGVWVTEFEGDLPTCKTCMNVKEASQRVGA